MRDFATEILKIFWGIAPEPHAGDKTSPPQCLCPGMEKSKVGNPIACIIRSFLLSALGSNKCGF